MNSILTLIITYFLNPVLETSAGIFMIKTQIHQSLRLQISDLIFYLCTILTLLLFPSEQPFFMWVFGLLLYLVYVFATVKDTALNRFLLFMLVHWSIFLLQCMILGIMYFVFRITSFTTASISLLGNFLTFVSTVLFFQFQNRIFQGQF